MSDELEVRHVEGLRADTSGAVAKLVGHAIRTNVLSENLGGFRELIAPEALRAALGRGPDLRALVNHNTDRVVGRVSAKTLRVTQDGSGLRFEVDVPAHEAGLVDSIARGDIDGASFAFRTLQDAWDETTTPPTRTLLDFELRELSVGVPFPAYPQTHVAALRSLERHHQHRKETPPMAEPTVTVTDPVPPVPPTVSPEHRDVEVVGESRILKPGDSYQGWIERAGKADPQFKALSFGQFLRATVLGPRTDLERRALAEGSDSTGGITVPDITLARFIDKLRAATVVFRAGAQTVPLTSDVTKIAKLTGDPTVAWRDENDEINAADPTFTGVQFTPRSIAALVKISRELVEDSINVEAMLERAFAQSMAVELDRVALLGTGSAPEPRGIANTQDVGSVSGGGALTSWDKVLDAVFEVLVDNGPMPTAIIMAPSTTVAMAKLKTSTEDLPLPRPPLIADIPIYTTTALQTDPTPDTGRTIILGDFSQLMIGIRAQLRIEILKERYAEFLQYGFLAHLRADVALQHPEAFAMVTGTQP